MSIRSQIGIYSAREKNLEDYAILLYIHNDGDGYPQRVLPLLESIVKKFNEKRDTSNYEHLSAWILYEFMSDHIQSNIKRNKIPAKDFLGHGISKNIHVDIEYFYGVFPGRIEVFKTGIYTDINEWNKIQTVYF